MSNCKLRVAVGLSQSQRPARIQSICATATTLPTPRATRPSQWTTASQMGPPKSAGSGSSSSSNSDLDLNQSQRETRMLCLVTATTEVQLRSAQTGRHSMGAQREPSACVWFACEPNQASRSFDTTSRLTRQLVVAVARSKVEKAN